MKSKWIIYNVVSRYTPNKHPVSAGAFWGYTSIKQCIGRFLYEFLCRFYEMIILFHEMISVKAHFVPNFAVVKHQRYAQC